jgi:O-antigen/teichoic acid export membrane protein
MLDYFKRLSKQTLVYGLGDAATRVVGLILLPIYTRFLTPEDYGKLAITILFPTVLSLLLEAGMRSALFKFYFDNAVERPKLTGTVFLFLLAVAAAFLTPIILLLDSLLLPVFKDASLIPLIQLALIGTFFDLGSVTPFAIFRAEQRASQYAVLSVARFLISATLSIIAVVVLGWGVVGLVYANLLTSALFFLICVMMTFRSIQWVIDFKLLKNLLRFGLPLVPANLAGWGLTFSDRFFLERYGNLKQVGVYAVGYSIGGILSMISGWFNTAWLPYGYSVAQQPDARQFYARALTYALTLFTFVGLVLSLFAPEALYLLATPPYYGAASVVPFIVLSHLFFSMNYMIAMGLDLTGKTFYYPFIVGASAAVNLLLNFLLIPPFGMIGAATSTALSYMLMPVLAYVIVRRFYPVPYEWARMSKLFIISVGIYLIGMLIKTGRFWLDIALGGVLLIVWCLGLYLLRFFTQKELAAARAASLYLPQLFRKELEHRPSKAR